MKRVCLTGATGFIGRHLVRDLLDHGYSVRALVRSPERAAELVDAGVELHCGDVVDPESLERAFAGVDGVFHLAAMYKFGARVRAMREVNVGGAGNVLAAAKRQGVARVVYCGSDTSLGDSRGEIRTEEYFVDSKPRSQYERTKREAHHLVVERMESGDPVINAIVSTVYGPGDPSAIGELIELYIARRIPLVYDPDAGYTLAHVDDVACALRLAYERGRVGESYLISGTPVSFAELYAHLETATGLPAPSRALPRWLRGPLMPVLMGLGVLLGKRPGETHELLKMASGVTRWFSSAKAQRELGWQPRTLDDGLRETVAPLLELSAASGAKKSLIKGR